MHPIISRFKWDLVLLGLIAFGTIYVAVWVLRYRTPISLGYVSHCGLCLTNSSGREILFRVSSPQFKCGEVWTELSPAAESIYASPGQPLLPIPAGKLAPRATGTWAVTGPRHIGPATPPNATAWRIGVVWNFASPTRFQRWTDQALGFVTGRMALPNKVTYTNYSPEVCF